MFAGPTEKGRVCSAWFAFTAGQQGALKVFAFEQWIWKVQWQAWSPPSSNPFLPVLYRDA